MPISFSAPIDVQFLSNANDATQFYKWEIFKEKSLVTNRTDKDQRYTFTEAGNYIVRITVSNNICSFTDSIAVVVSESAIYVPLVFTPNGDGFNDEFRVAYKSLISFQCWVYNRWGRQVYYWSDPTKGWDGNINGKKAVPGPYFYVIKAIGSDKKAYKLKGDINLLRGGGN
jgi:gliding motility-associated-like protein